MTRMNEVRLAYGKPVNQVRSLASGVTQPRGCASPPSWTPSPGGHAGAGGRREGDASPGMASRPLLTAPPPPVQQGSLWPWWVRARHQQDAVCVWPKGLVWRTKPKYSELWLVPSHLPSPVCLMASPACKHSGRKSMVLVFFQQRQFRVTCHPSAATPSLSQILGSGRDAELGVHVRSPDASMSFLLPEATFLTRHSICPRSWRPSLSSMQ